MKQILVHQASEVWLSTQRIYYKVDISIDGFHDHAWIEIPTARGETVLCGCVYRSPTCDVDLNGCRKSTQAIVKHMSEAYQRNLNLLIAGDFNYKEKDWLNENAPPGQQHLQDFINTLQDCFLYQHVTEPTRYRANETSNVVDLILSSEEGMIEDLAYNPPLGESDHICLTFKLQQFYNKKDTTPVHNIFTTNYTAVREELSKPN